MKKLMYLLFVFTALFSCKKKVLENTILIPHEGLDYVDCNCPSMELDLENIFGSPSLYTVLDETLYAYPSVNPNNPNEIVFSSTQNGDVNQSKTIIYNLLTQEKRILSQLPSANFSWGKKDWILFLSGLQLYKIKSNGDSLTPIGNGEWFHASWNATGDKFIAFHKYKKTTEPRTFILDVNGNIEDSIYSTKWHHSSGTWSHPEFYLNYTSTDIRLIDLGTKNIVKHIKSPFLYEGAQKGMFSSVNWISSTKLLFYGSGGTYTYDITTDKVTHIRCACQFSYMRFSHASDFSKIVVGKTQTELIENNQKYFVDKKLFLLNPFTLEEEEIIIP